MKRFFDVKSSRDRGTLWQLKAEFNRRSVSTKVTECYSHVWEFIQVCKVLEQLHIILAV